MTTTKSNRCSFCDREITTTPEQAPHFEGCPEGADSVERGKLKREWNKGWAHGFADNYPHWYLYRYYSPSFVLGWHAGKAEIDEAVEEAVQANYRYGEYS